MGEVVTAPMERRELGDRAVLLFLTVTLAVAVV
jgi:hypothetical protein